jgi:Flp pilus assembly protein TadG
MRPRRYTKSKWQKKGISEAGAALAEFALVALVFFILFFGIIEFSRAMFMYHHLAHAAREGSRYAIVHGSTSMSPVDNNAVRDYVRSITPLDPNNLNVATTWQDGNNDPGSRVKVMVTYDFRFSIPVWFGTNIPLASTSEMVISY